MGDGPCGLRNSNTLDVGEDGEPDGQCDNAVPRSTRLHLQGPRMVGKKSARSGYQQERMQGERYHLPTGGMQVAMTIDLSGRTAVITGASRGLGEAMAKALSEAGAQVALVARDVKRLESVRDAIAERGGTAALFAGDVTREQDVADVAKAVQERFGHPQILINNAGTN